MTYAEAVADGIWAADVARVGYIPSVTVAPVINSLVTADGGVDGVSPRVTPLSREEEAVGVLSAVALTGALGAIVMQDNGFGNALTALTTFPLAYHLPLLIFANTRGGLGEYNSMIHSIGQPCRRCCARPACRSSNWTGAALPGTGERRYGSPACTPS